LAAFKPLHKLLKQFAESGKTLAAICAAPFVLFTAGVLDGKQFTCYPGFEKKINNGGSFRPDLPVVQDGEIFTSRGMGTAIDLGLALTMHFGGTSAAMKMYDQIVYMNTDYQNRID
jgi:4-methyl-5(b-hydroxyethyl)-thiazole monophosphate biosynthesis